MAKIGDIDLEAFPLLLAIDVDDPHFVHCAKNKEPMWYIRNYL